MKTVSIDKFYANTALVDELPVGGQLLVTSEGKTKFIVTRSDRPRMTRELAEERSVGDSKGAKFDSLEIIGSLK